MTATSQVARAHIEQLAQSSVHPAQPEVHQLLEQMRNYYEKKLWHQLTLTLEKLVNLDYFRTTKDERLMVDLYDKFMKDFESKLNQLALVKIVIAMSYHISNATDLVNFLQRATDKLNAESEKEAYALILSEIAHQRLVKLNQVEESKAIAEKANASLEQVAGADPVVYSSYYKFLSLYYKVKVSPTEFYKNSLLFLVYTPLESIPLPEQQALAFDMGIAALVAPDTHNFGELLAHPVLKSLEGAAGREWLLKFLFAFNSGDIEKFEQYLKENKADIDQQPILNANLVLLRQKISILALMELAFNKPAEDRTIPFEVVAKTTRLPLEEVELLVMKALSLKLIRGSIDEVSQTVTITWVQPRVLDMSQIAKVHGRVQQWIGSTHQVLSFVESNIAPELYA